MINKNSSKDIYNVTKDFYFKKMLFFQIVYLFVNPEKLNV